MLIKAKNYEIIDDLTLELKEGLTVITGASNNGKTSIIRLLRSVLYNINSDASIQQGETSYTIGVVDKDNKVIVKRDLNASNKTVYSVNGTVLKKVGRNPVPEVEDALNIRQVDINKKKMELNFITQMEYPFLIGESGGFIYDFLSSSSNQTDFNDLIKTMKSDLKTISDEKKTLEGRTDVLKDLFNTSKDTYEKLQDIQPLIDDILKFDSKMQYLQKLEQSINSLSHADKGILELNKQLSYHTGEYKILENLDILIDEYNKINDLRAYIQSIHEIKDNLLVQNVSKAKLEELNSKIDLDELESLSLKLSTTENELKDLQSKVNNTNNIIDAIDRLDNLTQSNESALNALNIVINLNNSKSHLKSDFDSLNVKVEDLRLLVDKLTQEALNINRSQVNLQGILSELTTFDVCPLCGNSI